MVNNTHNVIRPQAGSDKLDVTAPTTTAKSGRAKRPKNPSSRNDLARIATLNNPTSVLSQFEKSNGSSSQGYKEVHAQLDHYSDVSAGTAGLPWTSVHVQPGGLPGVTTTSSYRVKRVRAYCLQPGFTDNNATNNVIVLAGTLMEQGSDGATTLACAKKTFMRMDVRPSFVEVLDTNFEKLIRNNLTPINYESNPGFGYIELARLSLINPDTGSVSTPTTLQFKFTIDYAFSLELQSTAPFDYVPVANPDIEAPAPSSTNLPVFPRAISLNNAI
jgi:hypothetical protein